MFTRCTNREENQVITAVIKSFLHLKPAKRKPVSTYFSKQKVYGKPGSML